jgi:hypothetical protein
MIGYKNESKKRVGISKLRLMAGNSARCVVCDKPLSGPPEERHKCREHLDWEMIVVDGPNDDAIRRGEIARLQENDSEE